MVSALNGIRATWGPGDVRRTRVLTLQQLAAEREDGTVLRAKGTPNGIRGYIRGKLVQVSATILLPPYTGSAWACAPRYSRATRPVPRSQDPGGPGKPQQL